MLPLVCAVVVPLIIVTTVQLELYNPTLDLQVEDLLAIRVVLQAVAYQKM